MVREVGAVLDQESGEKLPEDQNCKVGPQLTLKFTVIFWLEEKLKGWWERSYQKRSSSQTIVATQKF